MYTVSEQKHTYTHYARHSTHSTGRHAYAQAHANTHTTHRTTQSDMAHVSTQLNKQHARGNTEELSTEA
eukprot:7527450-Alexandrium_andersonii.AAC.1